MSGSTSQTTTSGSPRIYQARYFTGVAMAWDIKENNWEKKVGFI